MVTPAADPGTPSSDPVKPSSDGDPRHVGARGDAITDGAATESRPEATGRVPKTRDPFFDNAKYIAIVLVVAGHAMEALRDVPVGKALYLFLYMFHMPVFIIVSGYFSRRFPYSKNKARKLITQLLVPYVIFQIVYLLLGRFVGGRDVNPTLLDPYFLVWFLLALFAWRLSTPVWLRIRWPLLVAVLISLAAGLQELPGVLETGRILSLLPFFVLGMMLKPEHFAYLRRRWVRILAVPVLAGGLVVAYWAQTRMSVEWVFWRRSNGYLGVDNLTGTAMRVGMLVCATTLSAAFLALVPSKKTWFTALGAITLYVYLLHGIPVKVADYLGGYDHPALHTTLGVLAVAVAGVLLAGLLSTPPVRAAVRWAVEPKLDWAFRSRPRGLG
ncbi:acyltransferase family protein [Actinopolymorpha cephalotaxi]|uniref:Fucose 4-O-acetylase-like acetyltransferase n=1 Tax=Actinopolymorpha cephalotaxi TaxID=504797 RepID=A0ABX2RY69_9ACTN|nr:acyltransferase family protein [Actinopolymorpha cephalotaxi]NYH82209.1 fucose 4-O-acetylase-like acetyltransferase [Actinopolymorpha cephalotaxi]